MDSEEPAPGGIVNPQTWRYVEAGPCDYFIPVPAEARKLETVRAHAILMKAASGRLMGDENGTK